ncbi:MAG: hypothetical protein KAI79_14920 [Bacteroidales bacterium]|nr:hypothetical protein [Bacteroidales bacterium]
MKIANGLIIIFLLISTGIFAQNKEVLLEKLQGTYVGKLKKGLAHGKGEAKGIDSYKGTFRHGYPQGRGVYTWPNGDFYKGKMQKGVMHGEGVLTVKINGKDTSFVGIFEHGKYKGPKPLKDLKIVKIINCSSVSSSKIGEATNTVYIYIVRDLKPAPYNNINVFVNSGSYTITDAFIVVENFDTPLLISVEYDLPNYLNARTIDVYTEFIMQNPGKYKVTIKNN